MRQDYGEPCRNDEVEVRCILRVPGEPDRETVARLPAWAAPKKKKGRGK